MDETTRQQNRRNFSPTEDSDVRRRPRLSPLFLTQIISHISSNPDVNRRILAKSEKDSTTKFSKFIKPEFEEGNRQSSETMKTKKSDTLAKVSDSYPKTPSLIRRRRLQHVFNVEDIPLPEEPEASTQPAYNRKLVICSSKVMSTCSNAAQGIDLKVSPTTTKNPPPNDLQISLTSDYEESHFITSPVISCESCESLLEKGRELHESLEETIACQVKDSLYKPSPVHDTPVTHHGVSISKVVAEHSSPSYASPECTFYESPNSNNHSYPEVQLRNFEKKIGSSCFKERTDSSGEPLQPINSRNFQTPPPSLHSRWSTPFSSRAVCHPATEYFRRAPVHNALWPSHSRSWSWNTPSAFTSQEEHGGITSSNLSRVTMRKSQESSVQEDFFKDTHATSASPVSNWRNHPKYSPERDIKSERKRTHLQDIFSERSYARFPKELMLERTVTRAASLEAVSLRSPQTQQPKEPSCFYHLSPDRVYRRNFFERNFGANSYSKKRYENLGSLPISPLITWTSPEMRFLPQLYLPVQKPDDPLEPNLMGHQLLGDSQLLRFAKQILRKHNRICDNMRYLGLCVSGQTIQELLQKIKAKFYPVGDKIILMIGTNNFLQNHRVEVIVNAWDELISHLLCEQSRRLLLLTVPPIPKLADNESHWEELEQVNTFIRGYAGGTQDVVTVADISSLFLSGPKQCCVDYFEKTYGDSDRTDLIHLNERGFARLRDYLTDNHML